MKRKLFLGVMILTIGLLPISAWASSKSEAETDSDQAAAIEETETESLSAEEILESMEDYSAAADSQSAAIDLNLEAKFTIDAEDAPAESMNLQFTGTFDLQEIADPMTTALEGSYQMSLAGETIDVGMELYTEVSDDGKTMDTYLCFSYEGESGEWIHTRSDLEEVLSAYGVSSLEELESLELSDLLGDSVDLGWTVSDQASSWLLTAQMDASQLLLLIQSSLESEDASGEISEEIWQIAENLTASVPVNLSYEVEKETYAPLKTTVDFNDIDLDEINEIIASLFTDSDEDLAETEVSSETAAASEESESESEADDTFLLTVDSLSDFSINVNYSKETVKEILIPAEALLTKVTETE